MKVTRTSRVVMCVLALCRHGVWLNAQQAAAVPVAKLVAEPASLSARAPARPWRSRSRRTTPRASRFPMRSSASTCRARAARSPTARSRRSWPAHSRRRLSPPAPGAPPVHARDSGHGDVAGARDARDHSRAWPALHRHHARAPRGGTHADGSERPALTPRGGAPIPTVAQRRSLRQRHRAQGRAP